MRLGPVEAAIRRDLADRSESALVQAAFAIARRLDVETESAPAASVARELRLLLAEIDRQVPVTARSAVDDLRARRAARGQASG